MTWKTNSSISLPKCPKMSKMPQKVLIRRIIVRTDLFVVSKIFSRSPFAHFTAPHTIVLFSVYPTAGSYHRTPDHPCRPAVPPSPLLSFVPLDHQTLLLLSPLSTFPQYPNFHDFLSSPPTAPHATKPLSNLSFPPLCPTFHQPHFHLFSYSPRYPSCPQPHHPPPHTSTLPLALTTATRPPTLLSL